tara:strand:- start:984 stop:1205 length:222 start_codon:yes stop_codon:yes gene_type:complete
MSKKFGLTKKQNVVYLFIKKQISKNNIAPSYDEIKLALNLKSKNSVHEYIKQLIARGWLTNLKGKARSIQITK